MKTTTIAMMVLAAAMMGACGAEPAPTCDPRVRNAYGTDGPWADREHATCGEALPIGEIFARCQDGGEYFVPQCYAAVDPVPGERYSFTASCNGDLPECDGAPYGMLAADGDPECVDICPNIR